MNDIGIEETIAQINSHVNKFQWMDFEVHQYHDEHLQIHGGIDLLEKPDIRIIFSRVFFAATPFEWKTETSADSLVLVQGDEARELNLRYQVVEGIYIFKFIAEDYPKDFGCYIGAEKIWFDRSV